MLEYQIVTGAIGPIPRARQLNLLVMDEMNDGWELYGSPFTINEGMPLLGQAMTRKISKHKIIKECFTETV